MVRFRSLPNSTIEYVELNVFCANDNYRDPVSARHVSCFQIIFFYYRIRRQFDRYLLLHQYYDHHHPTQRQKLDIVTNHKSLSVDLGGRENGSTPLAVARKSGGSLNGDDDD